LTTSKVSSGKSNYFQLPPKKGGHFQCHVT
jgi:hypothetical protein